MLMLDTVKRAALLQKEAIWVDADGDEVLAGLTLSESHFFLAYEEHPVEAHPPPETAMYLQLKHKHLVARSSALMRK